ncbi:histidine biosynthesis protein [Nitrosococcus halophilus Nc 4]|uniref:Histidine biosynthesis protein n=1 Tax=Nitrosococcus halophilus (strain Nc4) TaxID=472759 RepID=D5C3I5_NITHN|nr:HisA/HisF-related TIM barrel protein [Nitrosococcus halophilus]ADE16892.1 histidine biosynthesis protein [Nitrosococcus halophilus Nc 4]
MKLLPVLDLLGGVVVHASGGQRDSYRPLVSPLAPDSSPLGVVAGLLQLYPFPHLYIADLDAIMGQGDNSAAIGSIAENYPGLALWVDAGMVSPSAIVQWLALGVARPVVGTETLPTLESWQVLQTSPWAERLVLSLDHRRGEFLGPVGLDQQPELWPETVIAMSLDQVGRGEGPDWALLERLKQERPQRGELLAAGGVRGLEDLRRLAAGGVQGVLLASALYEGSLKAADIIKIVPS